MIISTIPASNCTPQTIVIGRRGTYDTMQIAFDLSYLIENYGSGTAVLAIKRSQDESAYPAVVTQEDATLLWTVNETDTAYVGSGECQLMWYVDGGLAKTIIYPMVVMRDILTTSEEPPDGYENWIEHLTELGAETQQNAQDAAQSAANAEAAKDDAITAKEAAEEAAETAQEAVVHAPIIQNGYWYIWNDGQYVDTGVHAEGQKGDKGDTGEKGDTGNGIASITKTGTSGLVDTYTVTYTDGTTTTFTVTNGAKGDKGDTGATGNGIASIEKTGTSGNVDTYTITYTNGQTVTFTVTNGAVSSVAGKTGAVVLDSGDIAYDATETYESGTVGGGLNDLSRQISDVEENQIPELKSAFTQLNNAVIKQTTIKRIASGGTAQGGVEMTDAAYIDTNGVRQLSSGYRNSGYIEIEAWATIDLLMYGLPSFCAVAFYDENKAFISGIIPSGSGWQRISGVQTIPDNAKYYIVTIMNADINGYAVCTDAVRVSTEQVNALKEYTDERFEALINPVKVMVSDISGEGVQSGYIDSTGKFNSTGLWITTGYIRTDALENIVVRANIFSVVPVVSFYDEYKVYVTSASPASTGIQNYNVTVPSGIHYMRFSLIKEDTTQYYAYNILKAKENALTISQLNDLLYGKKLGAVGDSITIGTYSVPGMTYVNQIANAHNMTVDNQAIWGSVFPTGKTQAEQPQGSIYSQIASVSADCDMLIISGGINDADYQADASYWGSVSGGYDATLDTTTFCGAFEGTLKAALDKFKGKPILFVFEHRVTQKYQSQYGQHFEDVQYPLMIEMLNKWGIPYVDLFHDMPSIKLTPGYIALYSFDDRGIHPNIAGYRKFYVPRVESGLEAIAN